MRCSVVLAALVIVFAPPAATGITIDTDHGAMHFERPPERVAALAWSHAQTARALGVIPVAVADITGYRKWVRSPRLPASVTDIGRRDAPSLEMLAQLRPDVILVSGAYAHLRQRLRAIAPVVSLSIHTAAREPFERAREVTRTLGRLLGRERAARELLRSLEHDLTETRRALPSAWRERPLYVLGLRDDRHAWVYGRESLFGALLHRVGIPIAWRQPVSQWGMTTVGVERLLQPTDARALLLRPLPPSAEARLFGGPFWRELGFVRSDAWHVLPPIWAYGGVPSMTRFLACVRSAAGLGDSNACR